MRTFMRGYRNERSDICTMRSASYRWGLAAGFAVPKLVIFAIGLSLGAWFWR